MATLPTDFSVTSTRSDPIPNPTLPIDTPTAKTPLAGEVVPAPSSITTSITDDTTPPFALNHARILYENQLEAYNSLTVSGGTNGNYTIVPNTWQRWSFTATGTDAIQYDMGTTFSADTICIGAHNLAGATIEVYYDPDTAPGGFILLDTLTPTDNKPMMIHLSSAVTYGRLQINISGLSGSRYIGYISAGIALQMQRPFFGGHTPITDGDVTRYYSNETESGEIIGQQMRSQGFQTSAEWKNIDDTWYRTYFAPFKQAAKTRPFFFAWNLLQYPDDIGFCRISQDISAPYSGQLNLRSISMTMLGHGNEF